MVKCRNPTEPSISTSRNVLEGDENAGPRERVDPSSPRQYSSHKAETTQVSIDSECVNEVQFLYAMGYWLAIKRGEVLIQAAAWMCSGTQAWHKAQAVCCLYTHFRTGKCTGMEGDLRLPGAEGWGGRWVAQGSDCSGCRVFGG